MIANILTLVAILGMGCLLIGGLFIALAAFWSDGND